MLRLVEYYLILPLVQSVLWLAGHLPLFERVGRLQLVVCTGDDTLARARLTQALAHIESVDAEAAASVERTWRVLVVQHIPSGAPAQGFGWSRVVRVAPALVFDAPPDRLALALLQESARHLRHQSVSVAVDHFARAVKYVESEADRAGGVYGENRPAAT